MESCIPKDCPYCNKEQDHSNNPIFMGIINAYYHYTFTGTDTGVGSYNWDGQVSDLRLDEYTCNTCNTISYRLCIKDEQHGAIFKTQAVDEMQKLLTKNLSIVSLIIDESLKTSYENLLTAFNMDLHINFKCFAVRNLIEAFLLYKKVENSKKSEILGSLVKFAQKNTTIDVSITNAIDIIVSDTKNGIHIKQDKANESLMDIAKLYIEQLLKEEFEKPVLEKDYKKKLAQYNKEVEDNKNKLETQIKQYQQDKDKK